jgi:hypothetical protein
MRLSSLALLSATVLAGCDVHEFKSMKVLAATAAYPVSMSDLMVVDTRVVHRSALQVVGQLHHVTPCVAPGETADISSALNEQVKACGGQGVVAFAVVVDATPACQKLEIFGDIVVRRPEAP